MESIKLILLLTAALVVFGAKPKVKGLSPTDARNLQFDDKEFKCRTSSKSLPFSQVNDNYCDCEDGSDEPGTPACSNGRFWCRNVGYVGLELFSSQVWDGVCDCCDGSDEVKIKCKNTCFEKAAVAKAKHEKEVQLQVEGLNKKRELISQVKKDIAEKEQQLVTLKEERVKLEEEKRRAEEEHKKHQEEEEKLKEEARIREEEAKQKEPEEQKGQEVPQEEVKTETPDGIGKWEDANGIGKWENAEEAEKNPKQEPKDDSSRTEEDDWDESIDEMKPYSDDSLSGLILSFPERVFSWASDYLFGHEEVVEEPVRETKAASEAVTQAENALRENEKKIKEIEDILADDFGEDRVFYYMYGESYTVDTAEYTYELRPFDGVTQKPRSGSSGTSLGTWDNSRQTDSWKVSRKEMLYTDGVKCWGGPDRSTKVTLLCGSETRIAEPNEPNKCEYTLKLYTPAVCDEEGVKALQLNFVEAGKEEIV